MNSLTSTKSQIRFPPLPDTPLLSIIITSYTTERLKDIVELLDSIRNQTYPKIEIVYVVERSVQLFEWIKAYVQEYTVPNAVVTFVSHELGISEARNVGLKNSKGEVIAFIDDDALPFPNLAKNIVETFIEYDDVIGVTGPVLPLWEDEALKWFPEEFYWVIGCTAWKEGLKEICEVDYSWGVNMAFRREAFNVALFKSLYTRGAHEEGKKGPVGDDREFSTTVRKRIGGRILYSPNVKVWHKVGSYKLTSKFIHRYSFWQGYSDAMFKNSLKVTRERLRSEYKLLRKIIFRLFPSILMEFASGNNIALKRLSITFEILFYFLLGYVSYIVPGIIAVTRRLV